MKLLIVTQAVDTEDPVLGFFVGWITELSKHTERIEVICLKEGKHELPQNVRVHSLGKEHGAAKSATFAWRFLRLAWQLRGNYDAAFVHMNQEYILTAGWLWKLLGKRVYLWRNHYAGSWLTDVAAAFCTKVFCTSQYSYTVKYAKTVLMPVGIDTNLFKPEGSRVPHSILFLARMAPSKHPDILIEALGLLKKKGIVFTASFYGLPALGDEQYYTQLKSRTEALELSSEVQFHEAVRNADTPKIYAAHEICVNLSPSGMFDKTIFEAAAAGCLSLTSNKNLEHVVDSRLWYQEGSSTQLTSKLTQLLQSPEEEKQALRDGLRTLAEENSLAVLWTRLAAELAV